MERRSFGAYFFWTELGLAATERWIFGALNSFQAELCLAAKEQWIFGALHNLFDSLELDVRFVTSISGFNTLDLKCLKLRSWAGSDGAMDLWSIT